MNENTLSSTNDLIGFASSVVKTFAEEHPKETKIIIYGGLTLMCGFKFFYELTH